MKCYICKKAIGTAMRTFVKARHNREKDNFRDLCYDCYAEHRRTPHAQPMPEQQPAQEAQP